MWKIILLKWDSLVLAIGSFLYGLQIFLHPRILETYKVYGLVRQIFDNHIIGFLFMVLGLVKLYGIYSNKKLVKKISIRGLIFLWLVFLIGFIISPPPNTVWLMAVIMIFLAVGVIVKEE